ncbi:MAG: NAD(P)-dependent alcohol dehydrogenase [Sandaracinaceae bacterium]|nr:NAD(P)-dependent alcohol dehydrogenase [Sandaracinaceae bacterium]
MNEAWRIEGGFGPDKLARGPHDPGEPGPGEARVRFTAWSLNYRDALIVAGLYNPKQKLPLVPLSDAAGVVDAVGPGVTRVAVGDRVCPAFAPAWIDGRPSAEDMRSALGSPGDGVAMRARCLPASGLVRVPAHLSDREAASLPCAATTAWNALFELGAIKPGETVLVQGTGGVSSFALQFAVMAGARVIVTSGSPEKAARARALGAFETIDYRKEPRWGERARELTGEGVEHVIEVGGAGTIDQSLRAVRAGGTVSVIGVLAGPAGPVPLTRILMTGVRLQGVFVGSRAMFERMNRAIEAAALRPVIDERAFGFEELPAALARMQAGAHQGKITLGAS